MSTAAPIRSRRKPTLRVVGSNVPPNRHATVFRVLSTEFVAETWSFAEFDALPESEQPPSVFVLPGYGFLAIRTPISDHEASDLKDISRQALSAYRTERGID